MFSSFCVSFPLVFYKVDIYRNYMQKSAATSRAGGMRMPLEGDGAISAGDR